jgi:hypothetical protein
LASVRRRRTFAANSARAVIFFFMEREAPQILPKRLQTNCIRSKCILPNRNVRAGRPSRGDGALGTHDLHTSRFVRGGEPRGGRLPGSGAASELE